MPETRRSAPEPIPSDEWEALAEDMQDMADRLREQADDLVRRARAARGAARILKEQGQ